MAEDLKQIIIDGVDVSGCNKYEHEIIRCNTLIKNICFYGGRCTDERNVDCYYKQLKAKEQECERTKERLESFQKDYSKLYQVVENKGYIKELDQLKAELEQYKNVIYKLAGKTVAITTYDKATEFCDHKDLTIQQLKASLDEKNDLLQKLGISATGEFKRIKYYVDKLVAENERLKKEIRLYDCIDKWGTEQCHCACRCLGNEFCNEADKKINKLKQTLTEIKEIAERNIYLKSQLLVYDGDLGQLQHKPIVEILQKISKCEGNDE